MTFKRSTLFPFTNHGYLHGSVLRFIPIIGFGLLLSFGFVRAEAPESLAGRLIVVVNESDPESVEVGHYYAAQRNIPEANILAIQAPATETITIQQYVETVANPLLNSFLDKGLVRGVKAPSPDEYGRERLSVSIHNISYVVLIKGVPLRIANDPLLVEENARLPVQFRINNASVDSEIALLLGPPGLSMTGPVPNPFFEKAAVSAADANRILNVSRLDGPSKKGVIRLIDRSLEAEAKGLKGRAYIDSGGPHAKGDSWIREAGALAEAAYFDVDYERTKRAMDFRDRLDAPALYFGWYKSAPYAQWSEPRWPVPPGAIGFHLHSYSGTSVRSRSKWLGAFVAQGYSATVGNVYEPYLEFTHRPQTLFRALLGGSNFGDAVIRSIPAFSWQGVAIGDPLYRPFKRGLSYQLEHTSPGPFESFVTIREINRLVKEVSLDSAFEYGREQFRKSPTLALAFRVAELGSELGLGEDAVEILKVTRYMAKFVADEQALAQKIADLLHAEGANAQAMGIYEKLLQESNLDKDFRISLLESGALLAEAAGFSDRAFRWRSELLRLLEPPEAQDI